MSRTQVQWGVGGLCSPPRALLGRQAVPRARGVRRSVRHRGRASRKNSRWGNTAPPGEFNGVWAHTPLNCCQHAAMDAAMQSGSHGRPCSHAAMQSCSTVRRHARPRRRLLRERWPRAAGAGAGRRCAPAATRPRSRARCSCATPAAADCARSPARQCVWARWVHPAPRAPCPPAQCCTVSAFRSATQLCTWHSAA